MDLKGEDWTWCYEMLPSQGIRKHLEIATSIIYLYDVSSVRDDIYIYSDTFSYVYSITTYYVDLYHMIFFLTLYSTLMRGWY